MELCDDIRAALDVASRLGAQVIISGHEQYTLTGGITGGRLESQDSIVNIGESGLSARMFTPIAALSHSPVTITGKGSILKRPVDMMAGPLRSLGAGFESNKGFIPVTVHGPLQGGRAEVDGSVSSQFLTGLLMALPLAGEDSSLTVPNAVSIPYIEMTIDLLDKFGIEIEHRHFEEFHIRGKQRYTPRKYTVEGDWSGASCLLVAGAIAGMVTVNSLDPDSKQADIAILDALRKAGADVAVAGTSVTVSENRLDGFEFNATDCPDLFPALVALAANCSGKTILKGTTRLTYKESNRALALQQEFGRMGIDIDLSQPDTMVVKGGPVRGTTVDSHNDHRIAMAAGVAALRSDNGIKVSGAEAVGKSYPGFWEALESLRIK